jgi:alpha-tubulin suppressor-like RCC1 family protein
MFNSPLGSLESIFVNDYDMIDQYAKTGSLWLWGLNTSGQLGDGTNTNKSSPVQTVAGGTNWKQVSTDRLMSAAIKTDGTLWTWGSNSNGALGDNTIVDKSSPVQTVAGGTNWKQVSTDSTCIGAIKTDGTLWMWGNANTGMLGDNTIVNKSSPVQTVAGGTNWKQLSIGFQSVAAIKTDGTLWTWGTCESGRLGDDQAVANRSSPVQTVAGGTNWKQVASGDALTAAVKTDGTLWTWGSNEDGQLGDNTRTSRSSPVQTIASGYNWKQVSCGYRRIGAVKTDGTLWMWGSNSSGALGYGAFTGPRSSPVQTVSGGNNWKQVDLGILTTAAVKTDGSLWTWGYNFYGQLGDGTTTSKSSPVQTVAGGTNWKQVTTNEGNLSGTTAGIYFYDAGNLYPGGGGGGGEFSATISSNEANLSLATWAEANGWDGSSAATITIGSGVYIWSDSNNTAALILGGTWPGGVTLINNGVIMGKGGSGTPAVAGAGSGGSAIVLGTNATIVNNGYILGGGGAGQAGTHYIDSTYGNSNVGGGGGAGGGAGGGGWISGGIVGLQNLGTGGAGGTLGNSGSNGSGSFPNIGYGGGAGGGGAGYYTTNSQGQAPGGGGGGGRVSPAASPTGGAGGNRTYENGTTPFRISGNGGGTSSAGQNYIATLGAGGGGGYGQAGGTGYGTGPYGGGGAAGKAINLNGYTATTSGSGTTYGGIS